MIFDANAFVGRWPFWPLRSTGAREVAEELAGWGIEHAAICSTRSVFVHVGDGNCEAAAAAAAFPDRFTAFTCVGQLSDLPAGGGYAGLRLYPQHHSYHPLYVDWVDDVLEEAATWQRPVLLPLRLIMNWGMPMLDLEVIEGLVWRHPRVPWILAGINYLHELQLAAKLIRQHESVHLETSCVMGFEAIQKLVDRCGAEKILFGSGAPLQHGAAARSKIMHARIPDDAREKILGGNMRRLLEVG